MSRTQGKAGRIVSVAAVIAVGVNTEGNRGAGASKSAPARQNFSGRELPAQPQPPRPAWGQARAISDSHEGIKAAVSKVLKATRHMQLEGSANPPETRPDSAVRCGTLSNVYLSLSGLRDLHRFVGHDLRDREAPDNPSTKKGVQQSQHKSKRLSCTVINRIACILQAYLYTCVSQAITASQKTFNPSNKSETS